MAPRRRSPARSGLGNGSPEAVAALDAVAFLVLMADRIPTDDLYARLDVAVDADTPSIERAWRNLLKRHHPDIAGAVSLELAKLINVAHDWLADADRRARYDAALRQREGRRSPAARPPRPHPRARARPEPVRHQPAGGDRHAHSVPADDLDEVFGASGPAIRSLLAQAAALTRSDIDRLSVTDGIDPVADLRDVIPAELWGRLSAVDLRLAALLPAEVLGDAGSVRSVRGYAHALVLELFLWYYLADPEPLLEQMRRGWECSVGLPRYGPNTDEVTALLARLERATPAEAAMVASAWDDLGEPMPWPDDAWQFDFAALEVSAALARRDAERTADLAAAVDPARGARWRNAFASTAHVVALRPIFPPRTWARYQRAWGPLGGPVSRRATGEAPRATVRRA
jgi:hypothetical protein